MSSVQSITAKINTTFSLWKPQKLAISRIVPTLETITLSDPLSDIQQQTAISFDTDYPSFTFAMATGSGKTRLMAACIYYLFTTGKSKNYFVIAPGETIYKKLIRDFSKNDSKFIFKGWTDVPDFELVTGEDYDDKNFKPGTNQAFTVYIFNIQKFRRKTKKELKFFRFQEILNKSFGQTIRDLDDLVLLMDESHHYRADLTKSSISGLEPMLGLEFTATPLPQQTNRIFSYTLACAINDYIVKRINAVYVNAIIDSKKLEDLKLIEGLKIHEGKKSELEVFSANHGLESVNPLAFITTKDIKHGQKISDFLNEPNNVLKGKYAGKTLFVHSKSEEEALAQLLQVEDPNNDKEIIIHVNKLKEGWDVKNIFTIIPLRASLSMILTEQTIGRGVRLPWPNISQDMIDDNVEAFTLDIIAINGKRDNYNKISSMCNRNNITVRISQLGSGNAATVDYEQYEIKPTGKHEILIPIVSTESRPGKYKIDPKKINPTYPNLAKMQKITLNRANIATGAITVGSSAARYGKSKKDLINKIIEDVPEVESNDRKNITMVVESYLKTTKASTTKHEQLVAAHFDSIFRDISNQISNGVSNLIKPKHNVSSKNHVFQNYLVKKNVDDELIDKAESVTFKKSSIYEGYKKCTYNEMKFDSKPEKVLADILDDDKSVLHWIKNPTGNAGITIKYKLGKYYPDFFVETKDTIYVIEVKSRNELTELRVQAKKDEGVKWCAKIQKTHNKKWKYGMVPDDKIHPGDVFQNIKSYFV